MLIAKACLLSYQQARFFLKIAELSEDEREPNPCANNAENLFKTLDMGFSLALTEKTIVSHLMPYASLEWCETDRVEA